MCMMREMLVRQRIGTREKESCRAVGSLYKHSEMSSRYFPDVLAEYNSGGRLMKRIFMIAVLSFVPICLAANGYALCTKVSTANLRTGPGTRYEIGWTVFRYMPFKKVGVSLSGNWYAVEDVDGTVLWIYKNLVTGNMRCAVVNTDEVNIRTGPGMQYKKLFSDPVEKYSSFRVLRRKGSWVRLRDEKNNIGWAHKDYLWIQ